MNEAWVVEIRQATSRKWTTYASTTSEGVAADIARAAIDQGTAFRARWGKLEIVYRGQLNQSDL